MATDEGMPFVLHGVLACWLEEDPVGATGYDPGPVPDVVEPQPQRATTIPVGSRAAVRVVENVAGTGLTGLELHQDGMVLRVALPPATAEQVAETLLGALPAPLPAGGGR